MSAAASHLPLTGARFDLSPLYRHCLFSTREPLESHARVAQEFSDHNLRWRRGNVDTVMYRAKAQDLSISMLRYGAEVEIRPQPFDDFALIHVTLQGMAEIEADGVRVALPPGRSAVLAPKRDLRMCWKEGSEQLILKVPGDMLRACGAPENALAQLPAVALYAPCAERQWGAMLQALLLATQSHAEAEQQALHSSSAAGMGWQAHLEHSIAAYLLAQHSAQRASPAAHSQLAPSAGHQALDKAAEKTAAAHDMALQRLQAAERYMRTHLGAPVGLEDLAKAAGTSVRALHSLCVQHHGISPMERLRALRLEAARAYLQSTPHANVTEAALQHGFGHLGRFSAYYRERFGELPSHTRCLVH